MVAGAARIVTRFSVIFYFTLKSRYNWYMRKPLVFALVFVFSLAWSLFSRVHAQEFVLTPEIATDSGLATISGQLDSTPSSEPILRTQNIRSSDITEPTGEVADRLAALVNQQEIGSLGPLNFLQHAIRTAMDRGIPATTIAFILLFPLIASLIAFARHIVGLSGLSMYAPAALAVALLSIGILPGTTLFVGIILLATLGKKVLQWFKLPYLPRTAMILWLVSLGSFGLLLASTFINVLSLTVLNVFALLILILLSESFLELQSSLSPAASIQRVLETFVLGLLCALVLGSEVIQLIVILYPEITLLIIAIFNVVIGKYLGLRFTELLRFRTIMETEE